MDGVSAILLSCVMAMAAVTVEIKGKVTNEFTEEQYRSVTIIVTDRLGTEIGRTHPDKRGQYEIKISGPRYVIIKALLEGHPTLRYQLDTQEQKESTSDLEHNRVFGELRTPIYYQNIAFRVAGSASDATAPQSLEDLLAGEDPKPVDAYRQARRLKEAGKLSKAAGSLEKLIQKYPEFYIGYIDLGMILAAQRENDRALEVFTQAQQLRSEHPWAYVGLAVALSGKKDYQGAVKHLEKAVELEPNSVNAQFQLGIASFNSGDVDRALRSFQQVIALEPKFNPMVYKYLSSIHIKRQNPAGAARSLRSYLAQFPDAPDREKVEQILEKLGQ